MTDPETGRYYTDYTPVAVYIHAIDPDSFHSALKLPRVKTIRFFFKHDPEYHTRQEQAYLTGFAKIDAKTHDKSRTWAQKIIRSLNPL